MASRRATETMIALSLRVVLLGVLVVSLWTLLEWPPPGMLLEHGLPPAGGETGRTKVLAGFEFAELSPSLVSCRKFEYDFDDDPRVSLEWVETSAPVWISRDGIPDALFEAHRLGREQEFPDEDQTVRFSKWPLLPEWLGAREGLTLRWATPEELVCAFRRGVLREEDAGAAESDRQRLWRSLAGVDAHREAPPILSCYLVGRGWHLFPADRVQRCMMTCWNGTTIPAVRRLVWVPGDNGK